MIVRNGLEGLIHRFRHIVDPRTGETDFIIDLQIREILAIYPLTHDIKSRRSKRLFRIAWNIE